MSISIEMKEFKTEQTKRAENHREINRTKEALLLALDDNMERKDARLICSEFLYPDEMVILAEWHGEFITWKFCQSGCYHGHYYESQWDAHIDFLKRTGLKAITEDVSLRGPNYE